MERTVRCSWTVQFFVMFDMFEVQFWAKMWCSEVFEVWSCCYVTKLVLELTVWCSWTVQVYVMFDMFEVRFWAKMWCSESSMFGHSMFGVFEVRYFGVRSKTTPYPLHIFVTNEALLFLFRFVLRPIFDWSIKRFLIYRMCWFFRSFILCQSYIMKRNVRKYVYATCRYRINKLPFTIWLSCDRVPQSGLKYEKKSAIYTSRSVCLKG